VRRRRLAAVAIALGLAAGASSLPSAGCNGTGFTPVCTYQDGAYDPESGCTEPVEAASLEDALADQGSPAPEDGGQDSTVDAADAGNRADAADSGDAEKAADADAGEQDAHIADAHFDAKG
jgi:hypothetical protein